MPLASAPSLSKSVGFVCFLSCWQRHRSGIVERIGTRVASPLAALAVFRWRSCAIAGNCRRFASSPHADRSPPLRLHSACKPRAIDDAAADTDRHHPSLRRPCTSGGCQWSCPFPHRPADRPRRRQPCPQTARAFWWPWRKRFWFLLHVHKNGQKIKTWRAVQGNRTTNSKPTPYPCVVPRTCASSPRWAERTR